jgi:hypothetical protein
MAYAQDTITSANASNVFAEALDTLLIAASWSVVETLTPSGTFRTKVYKSDGTLNAAGYDWYIALMWNTVGTEQQVQVISGGAYDDSTHKLSQIPLAPNSINGTQIGNNYALEVTGDLWGGYNVNVVTNLATQATCDRSGSALRDKNWFSTITPSSAFAYWMSVTLDHVSIYTTITSANPQYYFTATLDVDPTWTARPFDVATNPVIAYARVAGISASMISPSGTQHINPTSDDAANIGILLPTLDGTYLPSYAWRDTWYLKSVASSYAPGVDPTWDSPQLGDGMLIGKGIDYYRVYGGSLGDTVTIDGSTYVLSGRMIGNNDPAGVFVAVLVE